MKDATFKDADFNRCGIFKNYRSFYLQTSTVLQLYTPIFVENGLSTASHVHLIEFCFNDNYYCAVDLTSFPDRPQKFMIWKLYKFEEEELEYLTIFNSIPTLKVLSKLTQTNNFGGLIFRHDDTMREILKIGTNRNFEFIHDDSGMQFVMNMHFQKLKSEIKEQETLYSSRLKEEFF